MKPQKVVYVEWIDAVSTDPWTNIEDLGKEELHPIRTCGFLVKETKKILVLTLNWDEKGENASCVMHIPKGLIKKKKYLKI